MHDCHCLGAIVARMRKVLTIPRSWYLCFRAYFSIITLSHYDQTTNFRISSEWESEEETNAEVYTLGTRGLFLACGLVYNAQPFCVSLFRRSWLKNSLQSSSSFRRYWRSQTQAARIRKRGSDWVMSEDYSCKYSCKCFSPIFTVNTMKVMLVTVLWVSGFPFVLGKRRF